MKTRGNKKTDKEFNKRAHELLTERFNAVPNEVYLSRMYPLAIETRAGTLLVKLYGDWVAMMFLDLEKTKSMLPPHWVKYGGPIGLYSGKYNVHFYPEDNVQTRLDLLQAMIERVNNAVERLAAERIECRRG